MPAPAAPTIDDLDPVFKGFADPTRIRILSLLVPGELCVCDIVDILGLPQPTVSRHLAHAVHQSLLACVRTCFRGVRSLDAERAHAEARVKSRASDPC